MPITSRAHKAKLVFDELDGFDQLETSRYHSGEQLKHHVCKCVAAYLVNDAGRQVGLEVTVDSGEIDVLDLGDSDGPARAIELETSCSPQKKRDKLDQYQSELIADVITIDISAAPNDLDELESWLRERIPAT